MGEYWQYITFFSGILLALSAFAYKNPKHYERLAQLVTGFILLGFLIIAIFMMGYSQGADAAFKYVQSSVKDDVFTIGMKMGFKPALSDPFLIMTLVGVTILLIWIVYWAAKFVLAADETPKPKD